MIERLLVDTGPIVALLDRRDAHHAVCKSKVAQHKGPLLTCWPVITEAAWLLRNDVPAIKRLFRSIESGLFELMDLDRRAAGVESEMKSSAKEPIAKRKRA